MDGKTIAALVLIVVLSSGLYFGFGASGNDNRDDYEFKGWVFAPARFIRKLLCGMFLGHEYDKDTNKCIHCYKKR